MKIVVKLAFALLLISSSPYMGGCARFWSSRQEAVEHYVNALSFQAFERDTDAITELQAAVSLDGDFALAYSLLGDIHRRSGQLDEAADAYENACRLDPWDFGDHFHLGQVYHWLDRFTEAIAVLKQACQLQPEHVEANYTLGISYYQTGQYEPALEYCSKAAQLAPDNQQILTGLGDLYAQTGDPQQAVTAFKQALEIDDQQVDVMIRLGSAYLDMQQFAPARLILEKALQTAPDQPQSYLALAYSLLVEGNHQLSIKRLPNDQPDNPPTDQHDLQIVQLYQNALRLYQEAGQIDPNNHLAYNGVGVACMMLYLNDGANEDFAQQALQNWRRSLELYSDQPKIINLIEKYSHTESIK